MNAYISGGAGDPEGAITAKQGSVWLRRDGGTNTTVYYKASGSGNTGWVAVAGASLAAILALDFLVGTATTELSGEIVVGTSPGGELGGTWASPTVDATHSGSSHAGAISTAEGYADTADAAHVAAADPHTGYVLESLLDAKGDLIAASADNTPAKLTVGANDSVLMADSAAGAGLKWVAPATPSTQAFGDAAAEGTADTFTRGDHKHGMPSERAASSSTPAAVGTAAIGTGTTDARADHVHATGAGTPSTQAFGDAAAVGSGPAAAMTDHKHAMPADPVTAHVAASDPHTGYAKETEYLFRFSFSKAGVLATGVGTFRAYNDSGATLNIKKIRASAGAAGPVGAAILCDVNVDGSTIWSTQANRVTIADGATTGTQTSFDTTTISDGHYFTVDVDQVGSTTPGTDLVVDIWCSLA